MEPHPRTPSARRHLVVVAVVAAAVTLGGCGWFSGGDDDAEEPARRAPQFRADEESTTSDPSTTGSTTEDGAADDTTTTTVDDTPEGFAEAEDANPDHAEGELDFLTDISTEDLDRTDPEVLALGWGCRFRAKPARESSQEWARRLSPPATSELVTKLNQIRAGGDGQTTRVLAVAAVPIPADDIDAPKVLAEGDRVFRVVCRAVTFGSDGEKVADDALTPVLVVVTPASDGQWSVADFSFGALAYGAR